MFVGRDNANGGALTTDVNMIQFGLTPLIKSLSNRESFRKTKAKAIKQSRMTVETVMKTKTKTRRMYSTVLCCTGVISEK